MVITRVWFSGRKSRSVNKFFQQPDLGHRWDFTPQVSRPDKTNPPPRGRFLNVTPGFNYDMQSIHMSAGFAGRHVMGFGDLSIDGFMEVNNQKYSYT